MYCAVYNLDYVVYSVQKKPVRHLIGFLYEQSANRVMWKKLMMSYPANQFFLPHDPDQ